MKINTVATTTQFAKLLSKERTSLLRENNACKTLLSESVIQLDLSSVQIVSIQELLWSMPNE